MSDVEFHSVRAREELNASRRAKSENAALLHLRLSTLHQEQARALRRDSSSETQDGAR